MSQKRIKKRSLMPHRVITEKQWQEKYADLDEANRPIIVKHEPDKGLLEIRAKTVQETADVLRNRKVGE